MKRILLSLTIILASMASLHAQPKSMGIRIGATAFEASYLHEFTSTQFLEGNFGVDFGYNAKGQPGIRATGIYNFVWARPAWTASGTWSLYAGPGATIGFVNDIVPYEIGGNITGFTDNGFMLGATVQVGIEYSFDFPLSLALDIRPCFGLHINDGYITDPITNTRPYYGRKIGFYDNGLLGFVPSVSVRYRF